MPPSLDNPFRKPPRSKKEAEEISELLVGKAAKNEKVVKDAPVIELSPEEKAKAEKVDTTPWTREQMEEWAEKFGRNKGWVSDNLAQNQDGTWWADDLDLRFIKNGQDFPKGITKIHGNIGLGGLTSAEGLILPESISGNLYLDSLTSAEGLTLTESFIGKISFSNLTTSKDLILPDDFNGIIFLDLLPDSEKEALRKKYPNATIV